ncbi:MAG: hypothetical protein U0271_35925 [Polyangiaceae bacterium]
MLVGAGLLVGCGNKENGDGSGSNTSTTSGSNKTSTSSSQTPSGSNKSTADAPPTTSGSAPAPTTSASTTPEKKAEIDPADILKDDGGPEEGILNVDLSAVKDDAPALGGEAAVKAPPAAPAGAKLEWLSAGPLMIPNPGWKLQKKDDIGLLMSPDQKALLLFTGFKTPQDGLKRVDDIVGHAKFKDVKWKKPTPVTLGPNKVPGLFGKGHATSAGKGVKLFYVLIKNQPENLLVIGGADDGGEDSLKVGLAIIDNIKKQ